MAELDGGKLRAGTAGPQSVGLLGSVAVLQFEKRQ
jgi:hypothetical protein